MNRAVTVGKDCCGLWEGHGVARQLHKLQPSGGEGVVCSELRGLAAACCFGPAALCFSSLPFGSDGRARRLQQMDRPGSWRGAMAMDRHNIVLSVTKVILYILLRDCGHHNVILSVILLCTYGHQNVVLPVMNVVFIHIYKRPCVLS
jgi:hypothetical protein